MLLGLVLATAGNLLIHPWTDQAVNLVLYVMAVMWSAWYGGLGPGLWATALSCFVINFVFMPPPYFVDFNSTDLPRLLLFLLVSLFINGLEESRLRAQALSRERQRQMEQMSRLVTMNELAGGIAHELNQPLSAISIYCQTCLSEPAMRQGMTPPVVQAMEHMHGQSQRAGQILANYRRMLQKLPMERRPCAVNDILRRSLELLQPDLRRSSANLEIHLAPQATGIVCNDVEIGQVFINLIKNAVEAAREHSVTPRISVRLGASATQVAAEIENTGPHVSEADLRRMLEPFYTTRSDGLGMGLNISRSILESHGGSLTLRARPEGGMLCQFTLPLAGNCQSELASPPRDLPQSIPGASA
jgi:C4-dicarboxylate-specific signal transduction histidine kinase